MTGATRIVGAAAVYFVVVFAIGFMLGIVRVGWLVPAVGVRAAELAELPFMVVASFLAAGRIVRHEKFSLAEACAVGAVALVLLLGAEVTVALWLRDVTLGEYVASRDPVAGAAYVGALLLFACAPATMAHSGFRRSAETHNDKHNSGGPR